MIRVFVTNENPLDAIRDASIPSVYKYFDSLEEAYKFAWNMYDQGFSISVNAWNKEETRRDRQRGE